MRVRRRSRLVDTAVGACGAAQVGWRHVASRGVAAALLMSAASPVTPIAVCTQIAANGARRVLQNFYRASNMLNFNSVQTAVRHVTRRLTKMRRKGAQHEIAQINLEAASHAASYTNIHPPRLAANTRRRASWFAWRVQSQASTAAGAPPARLLSVAWPSPSSSSPSSSSPSPHSGIEAQWLALLRGVCAGLWSL